MPFITSDTPCLRKDCYIDDIPYLLGTNSISKLGYKKGFTGFLAYMPLSPSISVFCSNLIDVSLLHTPVVKINDADIVLRHNVFVLDNAEDYVISDRELPFGNIEYNLSKKITSRNATYSKDYAVIHTKNSRYNVECKNLIIGESFIIFEYESNQFDSVFSVIEDNIVNSIDVFYDDKHTHMKHLKIGGGTNIDKSIIEFV